MLTRIVLAYVLAFPAFVGITASRAGGHTLVVTMASTVPGQFQVFFDEGQGFSERESALLPALASATPREYRVPIPAGRYRQIRIDPGTLPGRYVIVRAAIQAADGSILTTLPLARFTPIYQLETIEQTDTRLDLMASPGAIDPQVLYVPSAAIEVPAAPAIPASTLQRLALAWAAGLLLVLIIEAGARLTRGGAPAALAGVQSTAQARPVPAIVAAALAATVLATYPLVFFGRSLVSPNNGGVGMLYDASPAVPGSTDVEIEDTRSSDVGAMLWAFVPYSNVQREALRDREWPLWNRYNATGRPLWGQGQTFLLDPLHWLTLATPDPALGWDLKFIAHRFVFAAGIGLAALVATGAWFPGALAAFAAPFVGVYAFRVNHPAVFALTYSPWLLLAWFLLARSSTRVERARAVVLLAVALSLLLFASPPKEGIASALAACAAGGLTVLMSPGWRGRWQKLTAATTAGVLAVLVTAPHWLIFLDTWKLCATVYDVPYADVGGLANAVALSLGPLTPGPALPGVHLLALVLVLAASTAPRRLLGNPAVFASALSALACLLVAFGLVPVAWLLETPFIANIGHLHDVFITAAVPVLLILAAFGAAVLRGAGGARVLSATMLVLAVSAWLLGRVVQMTPAHAFEPWACALALAAAAMLPGCLAVIKQTTVLPAIAAAAVIVVLVLPGGLHVQSGLAPVDHLLLQPRLRVALDTNSPAVDAMHRAEVEPGRAVGIDWALLEGSQALYEVEGIGGPDALGIARYDELVDAASIPRQDWLTKVGFSDVSRMAPLLDLLNTRYFFSAPKFVPPGLVDLPFSAPDRLTLQRRDTAWPRAFFVDGVSRYSDAADLLRKASIERKPFAAIQDGDGQAFATTRGLDSSRGDIIPAQAYRLTTNTTRFTVASNAPGVIVLDEAFLPGEFVATLNGRVVPYFRVNHVFKGVAVPSAGEWDVNFEYRPAHWRISLALAGLGVVGCAAIGFEARPRRRRSRPA